MHTCVIELVKEQARLPNQISLTGEWSAELQQRILTALAKGGETVLIKWEPQVAAVLKDGYHGEDIPLILRRKAGANPTFVNPLAGRGFTRTNNYNVYFKLR